MLDNELISILRSCSNPKGHICSECRAFGKGDRDCTKHAMIKAVKDIERLDSENADIREQLVRKDEEIKGLYDAIERRDHMLAKQSMSLSYLQKRYNETNDFEQTQCAKLLVKLARVTAERDAAIADLKSIAAKAIFCGIAPCEVCRFDCDWCPNDHDSDNFVWRGPQQEEIEKNDRAEDHPKSNSGQNPTV